MKRLTISSQKAEFRLMKIEQLNLYPSQSKIIEAAIDLLFEKLESDLQKEHGKAHFEEIQGALGRQSLRQDDEDEEKKFERKINDTPKSVAKSAR